METSVLEDWLRVASSPVLAGVRTSERSSSELAASTIVHAWAQIRVCVQQRKALTPEDSDAFHLLNRHRHSLHLAESQAKLLQALLTEVTSDDAAFLGFVRRFAILGLLAWVRKSFSMSGTTPIAASSKQSATETLPTVVQSAQKALEERPISDHYTGEVILLLGTISTLLFISAAVRRDCLATIAGALEQRSNVIVRGAIAEAFAGVGYALTVSSQEHLVPILRSLLLLWVPRLEQPLGSGDGHPTTGAEMGGMQPTGFNNGIVLKDLVMLLHLMDYLGSIFLARQASRVVGGFPRVEVMQETILGVLVDYDDCRAHGAVQCTAIMAASGLLRSWYRWDQADKGRGAAAAAAPIAMLAIKIRLEEIVVKICEQAAVAEGRTPILTEDPPAIYPSLSLRAENWHLCRCVSVAVSRCRGISSHHSILRCLLRCLFSDALQLDTLYSVLMAELSAGFEKPNLQHQQSLLSSSGFSKDETSDLGSSLSALQVHVDSFFFQELGAIARAMCDQYRWTTGELRECTENLVSAYARNLYEKQRQLVLVTQRQQSQGWERALDKVHVAAFLTVVIFFSITIRDHTHDNSDSSRAHVPDSNNGHKAELAALALDALSCVEYFRRVQLREFSQVIQRGVALIAGSEAASVAFARTLPAYQDVIRGPGSPHLNFTYNWRQDEVQTARILFYLRIMPLCVISMPEAIFAAEVAPLMFLYMQHSSEGVTRAAHALFAAFLSMGVRPEPSMKRKAKNSANGGDIGPENTRSFSLKEQLVVLYIHRALQEFPGATPFQGLVAGVGAIARQLPAGSSACVYCLNYLVNKAATLYRSDFVKNIREPESKRTQAASNALVINQQKSLPNEILAAQKLQILLLHLILLVDLQVLPTLLKDVAKLILGLPDQRRRTALAEAYDLVGSSDDYTRKPILVPWLQSLSYLSVQQGQKRGHGNTTTGRAVEVRKRDRSRKNKGTDKYYEHRVENSSTEKEHVGSEDDHSKPNTADPVSRFQQSRNSDEETDEPVDQNTGDSTMSKL